MEKYRLFLATELPGDYKRQFRAFRDSQVSSGFRWVSEANWHLTLLFIGEVPADALDNLKRVLTQCFDQETALTLYPKGFYFAPKKRQARMIWLSFFYSEPFEHLVKRLFQVVKDCMENQGYNFQQNLPSQIIPHVTLARFKPFDARREPLIESPSSEAFQPLELEQAILMASERTAKGAVYTPLSHYNLKNSS
jgi:2'-5' RNA ligase